MPISTSDMKGGTRITKQDLKYWCIHPMKNAFARANSRLFALNSHRWLVFFGCLAPGVSWIFSCAMYTIGSLWVLHWSSWGWYQKPSAGASLHPFARRVSTSFLDHLGEKRLFLKLSTTWLGFVSQLYEYAKVFVQDVFFLFYWILLGPMRRTFGVWPSVLRFWTQASDTSKHSHFGRLGATTGFATFSNQPHRSTWKPSTFVQVWTIIWVRIFYTLKSPHAHPLSRR